MRAGARLARAAFTGLSCAETFVPACFVFLPFHYLSDLSVVRPGYSSVQTAISEKVWDGTPSAMVRNGIPFNFMLRDLLQVRGARTAGYS